MAPNPADEPDLNIPDSPLSDPVEWVPPSETPDPSANAGGFLTGTEIRIAVASVVGAGLLTMLILMTRAGAAAAPPAATPETRVPVRPTAAAVVASAAAPSTWTDENSPTWVAGSRGAVAYEVPAVRPITVWMRAVTPSLVVRCEGKVLDVFVFTDSAARIESNTLDHTVRFKFDDEEETSALWPDADTHDALFAPDGAKFAHRIAAARTLRFGFTPHNAEPVTMEFPVAGLAPLLARAAKGGCRAAAAL